MRAAHRPLLWAAAVAGAALLGSASDARADAGPKFGSGVWMPVGVTLGGAFRDEPVSGFVIGGELSVVYLWMDSGLQGMWLGGVADATYDFGVEGVRHRVGPEIGYGPVGIEVAYVGLDRDEEGYRPGINLRAVAGISVLALYGGWGHMFGDGPGANYGEFGGLLKFPIPLAVDPAQPRPVPAEPYHPDGDGPPTESVSAEPEPEPPAPYADPLVQEVEPLPRRPDDERWATPPEPAPAPAPEPAPQPHREPSSP